MQFLLKNRHIFMLIVVNAKLPRKAKTKKLWHVANLHIQYFQAITVK